MIEYISMQKCIVFSNRKLVYFACQKIEASYTYRLGEEYSTKWSLIRYITSNTLQYYRIHLAHYSYRYEQDPQGKEKVSVIYPEIDDVFGLKLHSCDIDKDFLCLTAAIPDGFILFFNPLLGFISILIILQGIICIKNTSL